MYVVHMEGEEFKFDIDLIICMTSVVIIKHNTQSVIQHLQVYTGVNMHFQADKNGICMI